VAGGEKELNRDGHGLVRQSKAAYRVLWERRRLYDFTELKNKELQETT